MLHVYLFLVTIYTTSITYALYKAEPYWFCKDYGYFLEHFIKKENYNSEQINH